MTSHKHHGQSLVEAPRRLTPVPTVEKQHNQGSATTKLLLTPEEAAKALRIGRTSLYKLLRSGEIPSIRVGRSRRIPLRSLKEWLAVPLAA